MRARETQPRDNQPQQTLSLFSDFLAKFEQGQSVEARYLDLNSETPLQSITVLIKQQDKSKAA